MSDSFFILFKTRPLKRALDILFSLLGFLVALPVALVIAIAIRLESPGEIFFSQKRLGLGGRVFDLYKFRKFPADWGTTGPGVTVAGDARMTLVGKYLERTKLDELPQLWNILRGEMSFVGPRPESTRYADLFNGPYRKVLDFVPGIFGPNQIAFRNESAMYPPDEDPEAFYQRHLFPKKARADIAYFSSATTLSDLFWIVKGLWVSVVGVVDWRWALRHMGPPLLMDFLAVEAAWAMGLFARFGGGLLDRVATDYLMGFWLLPAVVLPVMVLGGGYRHTLRHIVLSDVLRVAGLLAIGWLAGFIGLLWFGSREISLGVGPIGLLFLVGLAVAPRVIIKEAIRRRIVMGNGDSGEKKIIIFGTDDRGINLGSLIQRGFPVARLVGFLDNCPEVRGRSILDHKVLGSERDLPTLLSVYRFDQLWLSFSPDSIQRERLEKWTRQNGVTLIILPEIPAFEGLFPSPVLSRENPDLLATNGEVANVS